jgi:hypothetical protein
MTHMQGSFGSVSHAEPILYLTKDVILALDLGQALASVGLSADAAALGKSYRAVVVDADGMTPRQAAVLRRRSRAGVPMIVIADDVETARKIGGDGAVWFSKPLCSTAVADRVSEILVSRMVTTE